MKIAPLLAQYLYHHKRLDLPGIGSFLLDTTTDIPADNPRQQKPALLEGVSFEPGTALAEPPELINYISSKTGKIKALASADLDSHLELAKQFLNIGKPFLFEGIGTLSRIKGEYTFVPGHTIMEQVKDTQSRTAGHTYEEQPADYKQVLFNKKKETPWKKPLSVLLVIAGIGLAVWGGYTVYKNSSGNKQAATDTSTVKNENPVNQSANDTGEQKPQGSDTTIQAVVPTAPLPAGMWKFVVETAAKDRALKRFGKLQTIGVKSVQMETKDSVTFKIYFALPASVADTARIMDSLRRNYTPAGNRAYVEN